MVEPWTPQHAHHCFFLVFFSPLCSGTYTHRSMEDEDYLEEGPSDDEMEEDEELQRALMLSLLEVRDWRTCAVGDTP